MAQSKTNKTSESAASVTHFLDSIEPEWKREDAKKICAMMERISGETPKMWGASIIGFGKYHYKYDSGREGDSVRTGFSPRKQDIAIYCMGGFSDKDSLLSKLGKHRIGKSCLYIKKLEQIDEDILEQIIAKDLDYMAEKYPK